MGDSLIVWYVVVSLNGLPMASTEYANSKEGCYLAGREAGLSTFNCVPVLTQWGEKYGATLPEPETMEASS